MHTYTRHIYIHIYIHHTHIHTYTHAYTQAHTYTSTHINTIPSHRVRSTYSNPQEFRSINASCFLIMPSSQKNAKALKNRKSVKKPKSKPDSSDDSSEDDSDSSRDDSDSSEDEFESTGGSEHDAGGSEDNLHPTAMHLLSRFPSTRCSFPNHDHYSNEQMEQVQGRDSV